MNKKERTQERMAQLSQNKEAQ